MSGPVSRTIAFSVIGDPAPQGSKRSFHVGPFIPGRDRKSVMVESSKKVAPWREAVANAVLEHTTREQRGIDGPVNLAAVFKLRAPKTASRKRLALGPCTKPDLSKLVRSTEDAMVTCGLLRDDSRIVSFDGTRKVYAEPNEPTGAVITITPLEVGGVGLFPETAMDGAEVQTAAKGVR